MGVEAGGVAPRSISVRQKGELPTSKGCLMKQREEASSALSVARNAHHSLEGCGQRPQPFLFCLPSQPPPWFQSFCFGVTDPIDDRTAGHRPLPHRLASPLDPPMRKSPSKAGFPRAAGPHPTGSNFVLGHSHL